MVRVLIAFVYLIRHLDSERCYVGKTVNLKARWKSHKCNSSSYIGRAIKRYGKDAFEFSVLEECSSEEEAYARELFWVSHFQSNKPGLGFNLESGGRGGKTASLETRTKLSVANKGRVMPDHVKEILHSSENREKVRQARIGSSQSEDTKAKISAAHKGRSKSVEAVTKSAAKHRGMKATLETRLKQSIARKGKPHSKEWVAKISKAQTGVPKVVSSDKMLGYRQKMSTVLKGRRFSEAHREKLALANRQRANRITPYLSSTDITRVVELRSEGRTHKAIALEFGVSRKLIGKLLRDSSTL